MNGAKPIPLSSYLWLSVALLFAGGTVFAIWSGLAALDSGVATAVVTASATVLISVFSLIYSKRRDQVRAIEEAHRDHKRAVYEGLINTWFRAMNEGGLSEDETREFVRDFSQKLVLWSSDRVLISYNAFRGEALLAADVEDEDASADTMWAFEGLLYDIRRDLGHSNRGLKRGDLLRLFVNDVDEYLAAEQASTYPELPA